MNRWTSKKPFWPILGALGGLFVLAVAAPSSWQRDQAAPQPSQSRLEELVALEPVAPIPAQVVADREPASVAREPASVAREPASGDVELVAAATQEFPEPKPELVLAHPPQLCLPARDIASPDIAPIPPQNIAPSPNIALAVPSLEESFPAQQKFDLDALLRMRDALFAIIDHLPTPEQPPEATTRQRSVLVVSENDRLAMLDTRQRHGYDLPNRSELVAEKDVVGSHPFSGLLPEAAPPSQANHDPGPLLAMRPAAQPQAKIEQPTRTETIQPLIRQHPDVLFEQLKTLADVPVASSWSEQVVDHLRQLTEEPPTRQTDAIALLEELITLAETGNDLAFEVSNPATQQNWLQASQSLQRRLGIWHAMLDPEQQPITPTDFPPSDTSLMPVLGEVAALLAAEANGRAWHEYLLLDRIADASSEGIGVDSKARSLLAHKVLTRMSDPRLTEVQAEFLATPLLLDLRQQLQTWAARVVDLNRLMALVERYEEGREMRYAVAIARLQQDLQWSRDARWHSLAEHLKQHYRSSNMRIAFSDELLNRMVPKQQETVTPIRERIAGAKVHGKARTTTNLQVRLLPDPNSWRFSLKAFGKVFSNTQSDTWPARVRNTAKMQYEVSKVIVIDQQGLVISPAKASAKGRHDLVGVDSQLDSVPFFGALLREIARKKNKKSRSAAMAQVKEKVASQARQRMDQGADPKLSRLEQKFRDRVLAPIGQLALIADPLAIYTTPERAVMQLRLANDGQLGAHTPRPLAPSDSVVSMQMHETVLNNALAGLELEGRRMKLPELFRFFSEKFGDAEADLPEDLPQRAIIEFAARDAILVNCEGDYLNLTLSFRELAHGRDKIRNFRVHARFRTVLEGLAVQLVRDGSLQFSGRRLKTGPRIVLHSVIGKLLPKDQAVRLIGSRLQDDPRLAGLMITQLVIDDGWIGLALGPAHPERSAWRTPPAKRSPFSFTR